MRINETAGSSSILLERMKNYVLSEDDQQLFVRLWPKGMVISRHGRLPALERWVRYKNGARVALDHQQPCLITEKTVETWIRTIGKLPEWNLIHIIPVRPPHHLAGSGITRGEFLKKHIPGGATEKDDAWLGSLSEELDAPHADSFQVHHEATLMTLVCGPSEELAKNAGLEKVVTCSSSISKFCSFVQNRLWNKCTILLLYRRSVVMGASFSPTS